MSDEIRQRHTWANAGLCPMCSHEDGHGRLCTTCAADVRKLPPHTRRQWRRFMPLSTGAPIQGSGYTPWQLLGGVEDEPDDEAQQPSRYHTSPRHWFIVLSCIVVLTAGALAHRSEVVQEALWVLGFWLALSAAVGAITAAAGYRAKTRPTRVRNREQRKGAKRFNRELKRLLDEQQAGQ